MILPGYEANIVCNLHSPSFLHGGGAEPQYYWVSLKKTDLKEGGGVHEKTIHRGELVKKGDLDNFQI